MWPRRSRVRAPSVTLIAAGVPGSATWRRAASVAAPTIWLADLRAGVRPDWKDLRMANRRRPSPPVLIVLVVLHLIVTALPWQDISRRPPESIRGHKSLWRLFTALQMGNSAIYWIVGRRRHTTGTTPSGGG
jgi:hypothetical protein